MKLTWNAALEETEMVLFETVHKLLKTTGVDAQDVSHRPTDSLQPADIQIYPCVEVLSS